MKVRSPEADLIAQAIGDPGSITARRGSCHEPETVTRWATRAVISTLNGIAWRNPAALLGDPDQTSTEFAVFWHAGTPGADPNPGIRLSKYQLSRVAEALIIAEQRIGDYGITWYTVERREHHHFPNGIEISTPWRRLELPELVWKDTTR